MALFEPIPGETPLEDISGLKVQLSTGTRRELSILEADNINEALSAYFSSPMLDASPLPTDYSGLIEFHRAMFCKVWDWAGILRKADLNLGVPWQSIETKLYDLTQRIPYWQGEVIEKIALLHFELVYIHPFVNGNGRWSRLVANIYQIKLDGTYTEWPEEAVGEVSPIREEYIASLQSADKGNYKPLQDLHARFTRDYTGY